MGKVGSRQFRKLNLKKYRNTLSKAVFFVIIYNMDEISTSKWAKRRKLIYILSIVGVLVVFGVYLFFKLFYTPPSCFDNKQNQKEVGIDCGGPCSNLCGSQVSNLTVDWVKVFKVNSDVYSVAASIENPNLSASTNKIQYVFNIYDSNGSVIEKRPGSTFVKPRDKFIIFEPNIQIENGSVPTRAEVVFGKFPVWKISQSKNSSLVIKNKKLTNVRTQPKLTATLLNKSVVDIPNIKISAVVYDKNNKPLAVSSTYVDIIRKNSQKNIFFTWPTPFLISQKIECTAPVDAMLVFDRSGSMGFAGSNPPQPITDAKDASLEFIKNMKKNDKIGLVSFASEASFPIDQKLTEEHFRVDTAIKSIHILYPPKDQHTNLGDGIKKATDELMSIDNDSNEIKKAIVILTDGVASRPLNPKNKNDVAYPSNYARDIARTAQQYKISIYAIGLGDKIKENFLKKEIVSSPDNYFKASTSNELKGIYNNIAKAICKEKSFVTDIVVHTKNTDGNI